MLRAKRPNKNNPRPLLLWFDVASTPEGRELKVVSARYFRVASCPRLDSAVQEVFERSPDALCFETDIVDPPRLEAFQDLLRQFPRLPTLLLTEQHSEALATWAFRAGVWNYLVKPIAVAEFAANLATLVHCTRRNSSGRTPRPPQAAALRELPAMLPNPHVARLQPALQYVRQRFHEKITEQEAAELCGLRRSTFSHVFHATFGLTFRDYLVGSRIGEARRLLAEGERTVTEVVYACGFNDSSHFARTFKSYTGVLPSEYPTTEDQV